MTDFTEAVSRRRVTASALFLNTENEVLIVRPTYRSDEGWLIPGGTVEQGESPIEACTREVSEELGNAFSTEQLLCIEYQTEYQASQRARDADIHFVFYGGVLSDSEIQRIELPAGELSEFRFCERAEAMKLLCPRLRKRLGFALTALERRQVIYIENEVKIRH